MKDHTHSSGHDWSNCPLRQDVSETVYHYTSPGGLLGILQENTLRFTDCRFMNDISEYIHIEKPFLSALTQLQDEIDYDYFTEVAGILLSHSQGSIENFDLPESLSKDPNDTAYHYLFCASRASDSLGMWNHYIKDKNYQGYSIGVKVESLMESIKPIIHSTVLLRHGNVLYEPDQQVQLLKETLLEANQDLEKLKKDLDLSEDKIRKESENFLRTHLNSFRLFFKDESFKDEREYRFVLSTTQSSEENYPQHLIKGYTLKNGLTVPHMDLRFDRKNSINCIKAAPMIEYELAKIGLQRILKDYGYPFDRILITRSNIPIRF